MEQIIVLPHAVTRNGGTGNIITYGNVTILIGDPGPSLTQGIDGGILILFAKGIPMLFRKSFRFVL